MPKFLKPVECNAYILYGVNICIDEINKAKKAKHFDGTATEFVKSYGLDLVKIGDDNYAQEYIIGKQLDYYHNFLAVKLNFDDNNNMTLQHLNGKKPNIKLNYQAEQEVKQSIYRMGLLSFVDYYMIHSYKTNKIPY